MKKTLSLLTAALMLLGCTQDRSQILKVYNWADYMDESAIEEFEQWYEEQTGEPVRVIYQTFDVNETMLAKIEKGHEDFDVVCPSDYIIERMLVEDLLMPISHDFGDTPDYIDANLSPYVRDSFAKLEGGGKNGSEYAVGYMWGTTGIIYNPKYVTDEEASSWDVIRNPKFADRIFIKDSGRDVFSQIIIYLRQEELVRGEVTLDELMHDSSDKALADFEAYMADVRPLVAGWEADFGKEQMIMERGWVNLNWSGEGYFCMREAKKAGVELRFVNPKEGFTTWFDGWVIPKYARNAKAASYWINFMSRPDIVIRNMEETGYMSTSGAREVMEHFLDEELEPIDLSYFFGPDASAVRINPILYPDRSIIEKSALEHDWGERTQNLVETWSRVKGENANSMTFIVIGVVILALIAFLIYKRLSDKRKSHRKRRR